MPNETRSRRRTWGFRFILVALGLVVGIGAIEAIGSYGLSRIPDEPEPPADVAETSRLRRRPVGIRPDPYLLYTVRPGLEHEHCSTNAFGMRNPEVPEEPPADVFRVLVLGGSVAWGYNARSYDETFTALLESALGARASDCPPLAGKRVEVLNGAVFAYVSWQEVLAYCRTYRRFRPHAVVTLDGTNDVHAAVRTGKVGWPMRYVPSKDAYGAGKPSLGDALGTWARYRAERLKFVRWIRESRSPTLTDKAPPPIDDVVAEYRRAMELLGDLTGAEGARLMMVLQPMAILPDTKPLTPFEERVVEHTDGVIVGQNDYYARCFDAFRPMLRTVADARPHVASVDATRVFADFEAAAYTDDCHLTLEGRKRLARFVSDALLGHLAATPRGGPKRP